MLLLFDISENQAIKDYQKLAKRSSGGYIKATEGGQGEPDKGFLRHWIETRKAGLSRGAYHLWCPDFDPREQARSFHRAVESGGDLGELPPALHVQVPGSAEDVRQCLAEIERLFGCTPLIYTRKSAFGDPVHKAGGSQRVMTRCTKSRPTDQVEGLAGDKSWAARYPLWFANYISSPQDEPIRWSPDMLEKLARPKRPQKDKLPAGWSTWRIWQFSQSGRGADWGTDPLGSEQINLNGFDGTLEDLRAFGRQIGQQAGAGVQSTPVEAVVEGLQANAEAGKVPAEAEVSRVMEKASGNGKSGARAFGIDISYAQETFRPPPPEVNDLDFVIMKASQANFGDPRFEEFFAAASAIPIRGAYHYFITSSVIRADGQPAKAETKAKKSKDEKKNKSEKKAVKAGAQAGQPSEIPGFTWQEQAEVFLNQVKGKDIAFTALDLESFGGTDPRTNRRILNKYSRQDVQNIRRWVDEVKRRTGKPVLLYTRATVFAPNIQRNGGEILKDIDLWIARYPDEPATSSHGDPYDGDHLVKIPGRSDWRFWQYSDRNNGRGARYGAKTASVDLNVYNGNRQELAEWLGLQMAPAAIPQVAGPLAGVEFGVLESAEPARPEALLQLDTLRNAGFTPNVYLSIQLEGDNLIALRDLMEVLKAAGIAPQQVHINFPVGWQRRPGTDANAGENQLAPGRKPTAGDTEIPAFPTDEEVREDSFRVEIKKKAGKRSALQSFTQKDGRGKPIMEPYGDPESGGRITRAVGDQLWVSATHTISDLDPGDGRIRGADGRYYYYVTGAPENEEAAGLYVRKAHTRRL